MDSGHEENVVQPTAVQLYQRHNPGKKPQPQPAQGKTTPNFSQRAFLVQLNCHRWEMQIRDGPAATDRGSQASRVGSGPGTPVRYVPGPGLGPGLDPGSQPLAAFDLKTIKSCIFRGHDWIEITDSSGLRRAVEFNKDDTSFLDFNQKLTTILKLLGVKISTQATIDRAKWLPITTPASRELPSVPLESPAPLQSPRREDTERHIYCDLIGNRESTLNDWPKGPPPAPPPNTPQYKGWQMPPDDTTLSRRGGTPDQRENDDHYLMPFSDSTPVYVNDNFKRTPPQPPPTVRPEPWLTDTSGSSSDTSGSGWICSECTYWNSTTDSQCEICGIPKTYDVDQCRDKRKGKPSCQECRSAAANKSMSLDSSECRLLGPTAAGCREGRTASRTKSDDCEECGRAGNRAHVECNACRISAAPKTNSLDGDEHKRLDQVREQECVKCIAVMAIFVQEEETPKSPKNTTAHSPSSFPDSRSPASMNVGSWRCRKCALLNPANAFYCEVCCWIRDDAWQCQVCNAMISMDMERCQVCDVWRCRLCTTQNDARENETRVCKMCSQFQ